jgi:hypothetical protein
MGRPLTRDEILAAPDLPTERVAVPEWGGDVLVRGLMADERDQFEAETYEVRGKNVEVNKRGMRARLVAKCLVDEAGDRLFTAEDIAALGRKSAVPLDRLFGIARRLSGLQPADVEELAGNSGPGRSGDTPSDSPSGSAA